MTTPFKNLFAAAKRARKTQPCRGSWQPEFESLEDRLLMVANIWTAPAAVAGKIEVVAVGTTGSDRINVAPYIATQQLTTRSGVVTIQIPMIKVSIMDAVGLPRFDAAGNWLTHSYEQATVSALRLYGDKGDDVITNDSSIGAYIYGEAGSDTLYGGSGDDRIYGDGGTAAGDGQNILYGRGGNDHLYGGNLHDELWGGLGDDELHGGLGDDNLYGEAGKDSLFGDDGKDNLFGGMDDDDLRGGLGDDFLNGDNGNDLLVGEAGSDTLYGGIGNDTLMGGDRWDTFNEPVGGHDGAVDNLWGGEGVDTIWYTLNQDNVDGVGQNRMEFWNHLNYSVNQ